MSLLEAILDTALRMPTLLFTMQDLIVACWRAHPEQFGLQGYDYPDSNRIVTKVYGANGLIGRGCLAWHDEDAGKLWVVRGTIRPTHAACRKPPTVPS